MAYIPEYEHTIVAVVPEMVHVSPRHALSELVRRASDPKLPEGTRLPPAAVIFGPSHLTNYEAVTDEMCAALQISEALLTETLEKTYMVQSVVVGTPELYRLQSMASRPQDLSRQLQRIARVPYELVVVGNDRFSHQSYR